MFQIIDGLEITITKTNFARLVLKLYLPKSRIMSKKHLILVNYQLLSFRTKACSIKGGDMCTANRQGKEKS